MLGNIGAWAQNTSTLTFTKACGGTGTADDGVVWTVTSDASESNFDSTKGIHYGTGSAAVSYLQLSTDKISGTITSIKVNASGASKTTASLTVTVDGTDFIESTSSNKSINITSSATDYTFTGNASGEIIVKVSQSSAKKALYIKSIEITYTTPSNPTITASDVTYAADITTGEITYTISNAEESTLKAKTETTWIKIIAIDAVNSKVTFDMEENTATEPREGVIELTYGTLTKEVKVTQLAAVAKRTVTIEEPENGTLQILRDGEEVVSGSQVPEGTVLTAVVTPNEGYKFRNWQAVDFVNDEKTTHTYTTSFTYTVGGSDVTFKANFDPIVYTTITWSVNGVTTTEKVEQGTDIAFTAPTTIPEGYVFTGWYGNEYTDATTAPTYVTSATATNDVTYYAVFAKSTGGSEQTVTLKAKHTTTASYGTVTLTDDYNNNWNGYATLQTNPVRIGIKKSDSNNYYFIESPEFEGNITKIVMDTYNGSSSEDRTFYISSTKEIASGDLGTVVAPKGEKLGTEHEAILKGTDFNKFYLNATTALSFSYIKVTYSNRVLSDFRTSVPVAPTTATISISSACTDGSLCYGTFSSTKPFVVSDDIIVSEINITEEGELLVETYETGAVVPANTGVMVSALTGDNYEVELTDEAGTSVLGDFNMLRPTGAGITADQMTTADPNCLYYRLTMHQGETLGFFWGAADGAAFNVAAGKAYLAVPVTQAARVNGFVLGGGTSTGIDSIADSMAAQRTVYNLQGQRVSGRLAKGVYIVNGKKVIIK